jgi:hypothetical protein
VLHFRIVGNVVLNYITRFSKNNITSCCKYTSDGYDIMAFNQNLYDFYFQNHAVALYWETMMADWHASVPFLPCNSSLVGSKGGATSAGLCCVCACACVRARLSESRDC